MKGAGPQPGHGAPRAAVRHLLHQHGALGEASGQLSAVLDRLVEYLENAKTNRDSVVSALIYPAILLVVSILSIVLMLGFVVPQFQTLFEDMGRRCPADPPGGRLRRIHQGVRLGHPVAGRGPGDLPATLGGHGGW